MFLPLYGAHQAAERRVALAAVEAFLGAGERPDRWTSRPSRAASPHVRSPGRLEAVRRRPTVLIDAAHNPHGMAATVAALQEAFDFRRLVAVVAVLTDKDVRGMLDALEPVGSTEVVVTQKAPRGHAGRRPGRAARRGFGADRVTVEPRLDDALEPRSAWPRRSADGSAERRRRARHRLGHHRRRGPHASAGRDMTDHGTEADGTSGPPARKRARAEPGHPRASHERAGCYAVEACWIRAWRCAAGDRADEALGAARLATKTVKLSRAGGRRWSRTGFMLQPTAGMRRRLWAYAAGQCLASVVLAAGLINIIGC